MAAWGNISSWVVPKDCVCRGGVMAHMLEEDKEEIKRSAVSRNLTRVRKFVRVE